MNDATGADLAALHAGAWRADAGPVELDAARAPRVIELCLAAGSAAIAWRRLRGAAVLTALAPALRAELRDAHRLHAVQAVERRARLALASALLRRAGIEHQLAKGWALGRHYPALGLRPYGDIDVLVRRREQRRACRVLAEAGLDGDVDVHVSWCGLERVPFDALLARGEVVDVDGAQVHVLSPDDHLRYLCLHFLKHGGVKPLWLTDVAMLVERQAPLDWARVLGADAALASAVRAVLALAAALLGAEVDEQRIGAAPAWLVDATRRAWSRGLLRPSRALTPLTPSSWPASLVERWPNRLQARFYLPRRRWAAAPSQLGRVVALGIKGYRHHVQPRLRW